jgi:hypothetical protein
LIPMATYLGKSGTNYLIEIFTKYSTNDDILKPKREKPFKKTIPNTGYIELFMFYFLSLFCFLI